MRAHPVNKLLQQTCYKSAAGLLQVVCFYVCTMCAVSVCAVSVCAVSEFAVSVCAVSVCAVSVCAGFDGMERVFEFCHQL